MSVIDRSPHDDAIVRGCKMGNGDIVLYETDNSAAFIRADPESIIDLSDVSSR